MQRQKLTADSSISDSGRRANDVQWWKIGIEWRWSTTNVNSRRERETQTILPTSACGRRRAVGWRRWWLDKPNGGAWTTLAAIDGGWTNGRGDQPVDTRRRWGNWGWGVHANRDPIYIFIYFFQNPNFLLIYIFKFPFYFPNPQNNFQKLPIFHPNLKLN